LSGSARPNDQMSLPGFGIPVDPWTGERLTPIIVERLKRLKDVEVIFRSALHDLDGTTMGSRPGNRRMALAFTKLEEAMLWAGEAILRGDD